MNINIKNLEKKMNLRKKRILKENENSFMSNLSFWQYKKILDISNIHQNIGSIIHLPPSINIENQKKERNFSNQIKKYSITNDITDSFVPFNNIRNHNNFICETLDNSFMSTKTR